MPRARLRASGPLARLPLSLSNLGQPGISDKMGSISTRMTERFGCRHPFAGAGMAFAGSTADLALGVCAGGGIGAIGVGFTPAEQLRAVIHQIRKATGAPFNINFIICFDNDPQIRVCAEEKVPVASFHWGHPSPEHLRLLRDAGVSAWEQVGGVEAAKKAVGDGVEVIVAQGWEAGGHNYGGLPIMVLVPEILDTVSPALVLASGGIVDGRGVAAARGLLPLYAKLTPTRSAAMIRAPLFAEPCGDRSGWYIADAEMRAPNARRRRTCRTRRIQWSCCRPARGHVWARRCLSQQNHPDPPHSAGFPPFKT
jgi:hypothetical protein